MGSVHPYRPMVLVPQPSPLPSSFPFGQVSLSSLHCYGMLVLIPYRYSLCLGYHQLNHLNNQPRHRLLPLPVRLKLQFQYRQLRSGEMELVY